MNLNEMNEVDQDVTMPRLDPDRGYRIWTMDEIYTGGNAKGKFVPNVGDRVDVYTEGNSLIEKRVVAVDSVTLLSTLEDIHRPKLTEGLDENQFVGVGPGYQSETWRIFLNKDVTPHLLMVDTNFHVKGTEAHYMRLYKGREIGQNGLCISQYRDSTENAYSQNVPLYTLDTRHDGSPAYKRPQVCHVSEHLEHGDEVTAVIYTQSGTIGSVNTFRVVLGSFPYAHLDNTQTKVVVGIALDTPFLSNTDDRLIEVPMNLQLDGLFTMAKVLYSDGEELLLPISGGRFKINGIEGYIATRHSQTGKIGLTYHLADNEVGWNGNTGANRHITEIYRYQTVSKEGSYSPTINVIPWFDTLTNKYQLDYWLTNLDRDILINVTNQVEYSQNRIPFNGSQFGGFQEINIALQLDRLEVGIEPYRYVQRFNIGLNGTPLTSEIPYLLNYGTGTTDYYGEFNLMQVRPTTISGEYQFNLNGIANHANLQTFLERTYYRAQPAFDFRLEVKAPEPTHFKISDRTMVHSTDYLGINQWNNTITLSDLNFADQGVPHVEGQTAVITWYQKVGQEYKILSITPWVVRRG